MSLEFDRHKDIFLGAKFFEKSYRFVLKNHQIGLAGQGFVVQFVAVALRMQEAAHQQLGLGILALDAAHIIAALFFAVHIGHTANVLLPPPIPSPLPPMRFGAAAAR